MAVDITLSETPDGFLLTLTDEEGIRAELAVSAAKEAAQQGEAASDNLKRNLSKLGGTPFSARQVVLHLEQPYFLPASAVNGWRREAVELLVQKRLAAHVRPAGRTPQPESEVAIPLPATMSILRGPAVRSTP